MTTRKQIRDWFAAVLNAGQEVLGSSYPTRVTHFEEDSPSRYTSIYITESAYGEEINNKMVRASLYIRFHLKIGTDDDLDQMEIVADQLIEAAVMVAPPTFDISKEGVAYEGSTDGTFDELSVEFEILYRD